MQHPTLISPWLSSVLSVNYSICRHIRSCLPKPAEIEISAPGALVVISIGKASRAWSAKRSSLWNLSSSMQDFFLSLVWTLNVWTARTKKGSNSLVAVLTKNELNFWECWDRRRLKTESSRILIISSFSLILLCYLVLSALKSENMLTFDHAACGWITTRCCKEV